jgi:hypothetical protein
MGLEASELEVDNLQGRLEYLGERQSPGLEAFFQCSSYMYLSQKNNLWGTMNSHVHAIDYIFPKIFLIYHKGKPSGLAPTSASAFFPRGGHYWNFRNHVR